MERIPVKKKRSRSRGVLALRLSFVGVWWLATGLSVGCAGPGQEDDANALACEDLDEAACGTRSDCTVSEVVVFRLDDDGACERVSEGSECLERLVVTAGCAGIGCGGAAPWSEERSESGMALATTPRCGEGFVGWDECEERDGEIVPAACACACEM